LDTTSSINPGLANLLQNLSNVGSPLLSSPNAMAALQKASPRDIVELSAEATQLEGLNAILGQPDTSSAAGLSTSDPLLSTLYQADGSTTPADPLASLEQALADASSSSTGGGSTTPSTTGSLPSLAEALARYQSNFQSEEQQSLLGGGPGAGSADAPSYFG
jgi:hypothetical protein